MSEADAVAGAHKVRREREGDGGCQGREGEWEGRMKGVEQTVNGTKRTNERQKEKIHRILYTPGLM
jgi:hypothetical protein